MMINLAASNAPYVPSSIDLRGSLPEICLALTLAAGLIVPLFGHRRRLPGALVALSGIALALSASVAACGDSSLCGRHFAGMLAIDSVGMLWRIILLVCAGGVILLWLAQDSRAARDGPEFLTLVIGATIGMALLVQAENLLMILVALELVSLPSYALAGFRKGDTGGAEASLKYILFGAAATALMIYASTFLYGCFGTLNISEMALRFHDAPSGSLSLPAIALVGLLIGLMFKIAAVPLHLWCPDVFQGAGVEVAAFLSIASKGAALLLLGRLLFRAGYGLDSPPLLHARHAVALVIAGLGVLSMTVGNLAALGQRNLKRLLAYSSIAQAGYMLAALGAVVLNRSAADVMGAVLAYLVAYLLMNLGAFAVASAVQRRGGDAPIESLAGMGRSQPVLAACMAGFMFSFVGLPPLAGFSVKLNLIFVLSTFGGAWWAVVAAIAINSALSLFYYAKVVRAMYLNSDSGTASGGAIVHFLAVICLTGSVLTFVGFERLQRVTRQFGSFADIAR